MSLGHEFGGREYFAVPEIADMLGMTEEEVIAAAQKAKAGNEAMKATCKKVMRVSTDKARNKSAGEEKCISNKTGRAVGRPEATYPEEWESVYAEWKDGSITAVSAMEKLNLKKNTFYNLVRRYEA